MGNNPPNIHQEQYHDVGLYDNGDMSVADNSSHPFAIRCCSDSSEHENWVTAVSRCGDYVITGSKDSYLHVYRLTETNRIVKKQRPVLMNQDEMNGTPSNKRKSMYYPNHTTSGFIYVSEVKKQLKLELRVQIPQFAPFYINSILPITNRFFITSTSSFYMNTVLWELVNRSDNKEYPELELRKIRSFHHLLGVHCLLLVSLRDRIFAAGSHKVIVLWNFHSGKVFRRLYDHRGFVLALVRCQSPRHLDFLISAGGKFRNDFVIRLWNWRTGKLLNRFSAIHRGDVNCLVTYLDPRTNRETLLSGSKDGYILSWELPTCRIRRKYRVGSEVFSILVYNHRFFLSSALDRKLRLWNSERTAKCIMIISEFHQSWSILSMDWVNPYKKEYFITGCDGSRNSSKVRLWRLNNREKEVRWIVAKYNEKKRARLARSRLRENLDLREIGIEICVGKLRIVCYKCFLVYL